jgi:hypothetical protein
MALPAHSRVHLLPGAGASFPRLGSRSLDRSTRSGVWLRSRAEQRRDRSVWLYAMSMNLLASMRLFAVADSGVLSRGVVGDAAVTTRGVMDGPRTQRSSTPTCSRATVSKATYARDGDENPPVVERACSRPTGRSAASGHGGPAGLRQPENRVQSTVRSTSRRSTVTSFSNVRLTFLPVGRSPGPSPGNRYLSAAHARADHHASQRSCRRRPQRR